MLGANASTLDSLRLRIAALETHPAFAGSEPVEASAGLLATPRGAVHEVFADSLVNTGAALGFALAQATGFLTPVRPGLLILQLVADTQETGLPYGLGFSTFGLAAEDVVLIRAETITELLWAVEEAIACRAVGAVVADIAYPHKALDFTASRRLALRAAAAEASVFIVRYARDREATAARYRWQVTPALSQPPPFDNRAPGLPRWQVRLEKGSLKGTSKSAPEDQVYVVDWTENGFRPAHDIEPREDARIAGAPALPGAPPAALGHRLSQAG
jgi:protein ImuA